jgi:outer membrane lipoprotein
MNGNRHVKSIMIFVCSAFMAACSTMPSVLVTQDEKVISDYKPWQEAPNVEGATVRLGGVIAGVINQSDKTRVEVVNVPIDASGKPSLEREPAGRFLAYINGFVDPVTLAKGRYITLLGKSTTFESGKVGGYPYRYPTLNVDGYYLWTEKQRVIDDQLGSYMFDCESRFCRDRSDLDSSGRVISVLE